MVGYPTRPTPDLVLLGLSEVAGGGDGGGCGGLSITVNYKPVVQSGCITVPQ